MPDESLPHDCAVACAHAVVEIFAPLLRPEEQEEARGQVYEVVLASLLWFEAHNRPGAARLEPSKN